MANTLDPMDLKQIISLHLDGVSNRKIGSTLGISRNTVNIYMKLFTASEYSFIELLHFNNAALSELFSSHTTLDVERQNELMLYFEGVNKGFFVTFGESYFYIIPFSLGAENWLCHTSSVLYSLIC